MLRLMICRSISKIRITTGDHDLYKSDEGQQQFEATVYRNHELYSGLTHANDVALVKLPKPAILNNTTRLACLPSEEVSAGTRCSISGWGTLSATIFPYERFLKHWNKFFL